MQLAEKLQILRKNSGYSQEELAEKLNVSRQAVGKWESGLSHPDIDNLICLSDLYKVTVDRLIKEDDICNKQLLDSFAYSKNSVIEFLIKAKKQTYAGYGPEVNSSRPASHDLQYEEGDYYYYDTYLGGECFSGEEAVWMNRLPIWSMNYVGRVIGENFSGDFLKKALSVLTLEQPYRGPKIYHEGQYSYHCKVDGDFEWYQGYEEIFYDSIKIYECYFHGGIVK
ncbi:MAG TPA: DUF5680 domain-containing protein [Mobilitalea sp.]|nr:DUF5680 domain-containing protein [Mobilitalea sp.]